MAALPYVRLLGWLVGPWWGLACVSLPVPRTLHRARARLPVPGPPDAAPPGQPGSLPGVCRRERSRRREGEARRARDQEIRILLGETLRRLGEAVP